MEESNRLSTPLRFGLFEVEVQAGELRKQGFKIKLQEQPFQVLVMLLERPGEVVTRDELKRSLWPADTYVDFEGGLNRAINKLREALGDDADSPRFIETLPRRGYRFVAPVETAGTRQSEVARSQPVLVPPDMSAERSGSTGPVRPRRIMLWSLAGILCVMALIASWKAWRAPRTTVDQPFLLLDLDVGPNEFSNPAISPDGMRIVVVSKGALSVRRLDRATTTRLAGTEGASLPFFSPNGQWVAYFAGRKLQKVAVEGGSPMVLCDAPFEGGGTWSEDDSIIAEVGAEGGLSRIPAAGGVPRPLTDPKSNPWGKWPQVLPGRKERVVRDHKRERTRLASDTKLERREGENPCRERHLWPLPRQRTPDLLPAGNPVCGDDGRGPTGSYGAVLYLSLTKFRVLGVGAGAEFDIAGNGTLVYRGGSAGNSFVLSWLDSAGKTEPVISTPGHYGSPRLSPDGSRLALSMVREGKQNLWVYDLPRETWNRLTSDAEPVIMPTWTPDGEYVAFRRGNALSWKRSDGSGNLEYLAGVSRNAAPSSFSADGKWLAFWPLEDEGDLWIVPVERTPDLLRMGKPQLLLQQAVSKGAPRISPDGRWVAYSSKESGRFEIYIMPFSPQTRGVGRKWLVTNGGGTGPVWSHNGRESFFQTLDHRIGVAAYTVRGDSFVVEKARRWSETQLADMGFFSSFDVAPDGKRVMAMLPAEDSRAATLVRLMLNVDAELRRRAPASH